MSEQDFNENVEQKVEEYSSKTEDELLSELMSKGMGDGKFNEDEFNAFRDMILPMLTEQQQEKLEQIKQMMAQRDS